MAAQDLAQDSPAVRVVFFASLRETTGQAEIGLRAATVAEVLAQLRDLYPADVFAALTADNVRVAVNHELLEADCSGADVPLATGSEVAFLPPVTGG